MQEVSGFTAVEFYFLFMSFCIGACIGSFLNVVVWRLPRGASLSNPPSHCPNCEHRIRAWENIPIISWLCLKGRCSSCAQKISWRYPAGETATGLLFLVIFWQTALSRLLPMEAVLAYFWLASVGIAAAQIDAKHLYIPDKINYSSFIVAIGMAVFFPKSHFWIFDDLTLNSNPVIFTFFLEKLQLSQSLTQIFNASWAKASLDTLLGIVVAGGILASFALIGEIYRRGKKSKKNFIGWGDVKYIATIGAFLGAETTLIILTIAACTGFVYGVIKKIFLDKEKTFEASIAFGPHIFVANMLVIIFVDCYRS